MFITNEENNMNKQTNIPTVTPVSKPSTKAVFTAQDIENSFERDIKAQHAVNFNNYKKSQLRK